ncbi:hypothetical protein [Pseudoduganella buxea]|uniref:Uncharacterized protein n=1 Tax=Pseudoduganella buxea TaxID=1949069 RepID=A0A6I3SXN0_9BURK|nr:hypothetical protein [Pseudoduganella buxea]MTV52437.1 hypothetical protein [Pseudoduganella buxea]GGC18201.1 hypothetical protein GCM10011572_44420 [Pseudoduganella buxea]
MAVSHDGWLAALVALGLALVSGTFVAGTIFQKSESSVQIVAAENAKAELKQKVQELELAVANARSEAQRLDQLLGAYKTAVEQRDARIAVLEGGARIPDNCLFIQKQIEELNKQLAGVDRDDVFSPRRTYEQKEAERNRLDNRLAQLIPQLGLAKCGAAP